MTFRIEMLNLDGNRLRRTRVWDMTPATEPIHAADGTDRVIGSMPAYWPAVTDVTCPVCNTGHVRWAEAGYVPGYRICDSCERHFLALGTAKEPKIALMAGRRGTF